MPLQRQITVAPNSKITFQFTVSTGSDEQEDPVDSPPQFADAATIASSALTQVIAVNRPQERGDSRKAKAGTGSDLQILPIASFPPRRDRSGGSSRDVDVTTTRSGEDAEQNLPLVSQVTERVKKSPVPPIIDLVSPDHDAQQTSKAEGKEKHGEEREEEGGIASQSRNGPGRECQQEMEDTEIKLKEEELRLRRVKCELDKREQRLEKEEGKVTRMDQSLHAKQDQLDERERSLDEREGKMKEQQRHKTKQNKEDEERLRNWDKRVKMEDVNNEQLADTLKEQERCLAEKGKELEARAEGMHRAYAQWVAASEEFKRETDRSRALRTQSVDDLGWGTADKVANDNSFDNLWNNNPEPDKATSSTTLKAHSANHALEIAPRLGHGEASVQPIAGNSAPSTRSPLITGSTTRPFGSHNPSESSSGFCDNQVEAVRRRRGFPAASRASQPSKTAELLAFQGMDTSKAVSRPLPRSHTSRPHASAPHRPTEKSHLPMSHAITAPSKDPSGAQPTPFADGFPRDSAPSTVSASAGKRKPCELEAAFMAIARKVARG